MSWILIFYQPDEVDGLSYIINTRDERPAYMLQETSSETLELWWCGCTVGCYRFTNSSGALTVFYPSKHNVHLVVINFYKVGLNTTVDVYIDGIDYGNYTATVCDVNYNFSLPISIASENGLQRYFESAIDEVLVYDRVLTQEEKDRLWQYVQLLYKNGSLTMSGSYEMLSSNELYVTDKKIADSVNMYYSNADIVYSDYRRKFFVDEDIAYETLQSIDYPDWAYLTVHVHDYSDGTQLDDFTVYTDSSIYYSNDTTKEAVTGLLCLDGCYVNITLERPFYLNASYPNQYYDVDTELNLSMWQVIYNVTLYDLLDDRKITEGNITDAYNKTFSYDAGNGSFVIRTKAGNNTLKIVTDNYNYTEKTVSATAREIQQVSYYLTPYIYFQFLDEYDYSPFTFDNVNNSLMSIICNNKTIIYNMTNDSIQRFLVDCYWQFFRVDVNYPDTSYYRTIGMRNYSLRNITIYMLDPYDYYVVENNFILNDITDEFDDGYLRVKKPDGTVVVENQFDVEDKATVYLIKNQRYLISILPYDYDEERSIGYYIADISGDKYITVQNIRLIPDANYESKIYWEWEFNATDIIRLKYNDTTFNTTLIEFKVYNVTDRNQLDLVFSDSSTASQVIFTYVVNATNQSFMACFNVTHALVEDFSECKIFTFAKELGFWNGFNDNEKRSLMKWGSVFLILLFVLAFNPANKFIGLLTFIIMFNTLMWFGWLTTTVKAFDYLLLSLADGFMLLYLYLKTRRQS